MKTLKPATQLWFPMSPVAMPFLRVLGITVTLLWFYLGLTRGRWSVPVLLLVWLFFVRPQPRPRTALYFAGIVLHWLLLALILLFGATAFRSMVKETSPPAIRRLIP